MEFIYDKAQSDLALDAADIIIDADFVRSDDFHKATLHQLDFDAVTATAGTILVDIMPYGSSTYKPLLDEETGSPVSIDLADIQPVKIKEATLAAYKIKPQNDVNGTWAYSVVGK